MGCNCAACNVCVCLRAHVRDCFCPRACVPPRVCKRLQCLGNGRRCYLCPARTPLPTGALITPFVLPCRAPAFPTALSLLPLLSAAASSRRHIYLRQFCPTGFSSPQPPSAGQQKLKKAWHRVERNYDKFMKIQSVGVMRSLGPRRLQSL